VGVALFQGSASRPHRLTPHEFAAKWTLSTLKERSAAQEHFIDLCHVLDESTPAQADPHGEWYCFERGAKKTGGGDGWADVWKRGCFAWEYKGKHKDLDVAFAQLQRYAIALENPPLLVVSDMARIEIHTNFTNTIHEKHVIPIAEIGSALNLRLLKCIFSDPEKLQPGKTKAAITEEAAKRFALLAQVLRTRGGEPERVAHFLNRILFCLFAQDAKLLPGNIVKQLLETGVHRPGEANQMLRSLFVTMKKGGIFGTHVIEWFNGNLFDSSDSVPLETDDIRELLSVAGLDWSAIEPSIFGTLFERGLDPGKRAQIGAHYTDPQSIMRIVQPVVIEPLAVQWAQAKRKIETLCGEAAKKLDHSIKTRAHKKAQQIYNTFLNTLAEFRVLDPACGSGNFLYLALQALKDLEHRATLEAEQLGLEPAFTGIHVGVQCVRGIELNSYAAELARVTVWIGEIQWMLRHGVPPSRNPILKPLETIECRDAVLRDDNNEPEWPKVDAIIGNPPFLGNKKMNAELGEGYARKLRRLYEGRVPGSADLVCYWFEKARAQLVSGRARYAGLVGTNSIRNGTNRKVLDRILQDGAIFDAWSDLDWVNEGAAVRVSLAAFALGAQVPQARCLNGAVVKSIHADLTASACQVGVTNDIDLTKAKRLPENAGVAFMGITKVGSFDVAGDLARTWLNEPNPHGRSNGEVLRPSWNGLDITRRTRDVWIIDFGLSMSQSEAARYAAPFAWVRKEVLPERSKNNREAYRRFWWRHGESRPSLRAKLGKLKRVIATPEVSKHRLFVWMPTSVLPDKNLHIITRADDVAFGVLQSRVHAAWALRLCSSLEDRPRYTPTTTFDTFPFPLGLTLDLPPARYTNKYADVIANAAVRLNVLRDRWLNPPEWVDSIQKNDERYPSRWKPKSGHEASLEKRTLTNLYNERPAWLDNAHAELDLAVATAYGWSEYTPAMTDDEIVGRLLKVNLERAADLFTSSDKRRAVTRQAIVNVERATSDQRPAAVTRPSPEALDRRLAVVCILVNRLADDPNFGRTKMAKLFYLADITQSLDLNTTYYRKAAGPLDAVALYDAKTGLEALAAKLRYLRIEKQGRKITYRRGPNLEKALEHAREILGSSRTPVNRLIDLFRSLDTDQCEIVATLYACWNDRIIDQKDVSDKFIVEEFLSAWHERKRRFSTARLIKALAWMRENHLIPIGRGRHTETDITRRFKIHA